ncbi:hypothetical protein GCM10009630_10100 [Kribbella jejuensis]|uniref:Putative alkaline shock family protein YloU n=1 Tax=Kribbella jejuensis TaxID=236068 RepID=A0A542EA84_9ACTN|nr:DUF6286 domain-containing Asp23/Gls24 family envelope stress response protein [Kribbella jejuensis]TQJ12240.1 putative alkaline shock family protein YloU [Kribbella jejuensis]
MADILIPVAPAAQPLRSDRSDAGERGRLEIGQRVVEKIAEATAGRHPAVLRQSATFGRGLPKAKAQLAGRRARVQLEIPVGWGHLLGELAADVRDQVREEVEALTGLGIDGVDVDISAVEVSPVGSDATECALDAGGQTAPGAAAPAKRPVAAPAAAAVGIIAALAAILIGAVGVRETLVSTGTVGGSSWLEWLFGKAEVLKPVDWMIPAGIAAVLLGVWVLLATLKPRKATHLAVGDRAAGVWIRARDAARLAAESARAIDSVTGAKGAAKRRKVRVSVTTIGDAERVREELAATVQARLHEITPTPRVRARVTVEEP